VATLTEDSENEQTVTNLTLQRFEEIFFILAFFSLLKTKAGF